MAQVYSVNAVGYINIPITNKFTLVANQLNNGTNGLNQAIQGNPTIPDGTLLHKFNNPGGYNASYQYLGFLGGWFPDEATLKPGEGAMIEQNPAGDDFVITTIGEVPQGPALTTQIPAGLNLVSSQVPQTGAVTADLKLNTGTEFVDLINVPVDETTGQYDAALFFGGTYNPDLTVRVGQSFFLAAGNTFNWTRNFSVNP